MTSRLAALWFTGLALFTCYWFLFTVVLYFLICLSVEVFGKSVVVFRLVFLLLVFSTQTRCQEGFSTGRGAGWTKLEVFFCDS